MNDSNNTGRKQAHVVARCRSFLCRGLLTSLLMLATTSPGYAISPEFYQLLGDINGQLKTFSPTRGPQCSPDLVDKVQNSLQGELFTSAFKEVVVKPLESGAKTAASLLGAPGLALTTYGIMRCAMDETTAQGFFRCAGGESLGGALGSGLGTQLGEGAAGAVTGVAFDRGWDEAFAQARSAYEAYGSTSEEVSDSSSASGCKVEYRFYWAKRPRPGARGGRIIFSARVSDCDCRSASQAKSGHVRAMFDVVYVRHGNNQPGWKVRPFRDLHLEAQCCGQRRPPDTSYLFNSAGKLIGIFNDDELVEPEADDAPPPPTGGGSETSDPPPQTPPPPPPPIRLPEPEVVEYDRSNPCPACTPIQQKIDEQARKISALRAERSAKLGEKNDKLAEKARIEKRIRLLESRLAGQGGTGGESFDSGTGLTTSSYDTGDGRVRITVTDADGNVLSERFRERESSESIKQKLEQAQQEKATTEAEISALDKAISALDDAREAAIAVYDNLQAALDDCVNRLCRGFARCEQLLKHIEAYERAGLKQRSRSIYNDLMRRAREMGCFDLEDRQHRLFDQNYQLDSSQVFVSPPQPGVSVKVIDVRHVSGNNPFDRENPEAADAARPGTSTSTPTTVTPPATTPPATTPPTTAPPSGGADISVVNVSGRIIPIRKLRIGGPEAGCAGDHYHASSAIACDGTSVPDPAPSNCGYGLVGSEFDFPLANCANP